MSKISLSPKSIELAKLITEGIRLNKFGYTFVIYRGNNSYTHQIGDSVQLFSFLKEKGFIENPKSRYFDPNIFDELARKKLLLKEDAGVEARIYVEQELLDLVDRDFEIENLSHIVNITAQQATVNITRADAVNLINNNVQLADALETRLRTIISEEHAFIFDAINELRAAVDNAGKENAIKLFFNRIAMIVDVYTLAQIMGVIAK